MHFNSPFRQLFLYGFLCLAAKAWGSDNVTRIYNLKYMDVSNVSRVIDITVRDTAKTRVTGGSGKRLVISDTPDQQDLIAQLLPVIDQPSSETTDDKIQMHMLMNAAKYMREQKLVQKVAPSRGTSPGPANSSTPAGGVHSFDIQKGTAPYKSVYASDDAALLRQKRVITDEPVLPSLAALELKGIFKTASGTPIALLSYEGHNYTARDGGLFENNRSQVKGVSSTIEKDHVELMGIDHIRRQIKFRSSI